MLSFLLALFLAIGLLAVTSVTASAAEIEVGNAGALTVALSSFTSGDTIKLTADINYSAWIDIDSKIVTLDLNGFTLNATNGLRVNNNGKLLLVNPANGEFNVSTTGTSFNVQVYGANAKAEITSATTTTANYAVYANDGEVIVYGDVKQLKPGATSAHAGAWVMSGKVTVEGSITVTEGAAYAKFGPLPGTDKTSEQKTTPTTKTGYFTYTNGSGTVWVKDASYVPPPSKGIFGTNPKWDGAWWHYILFFLCFGFIWMWF